MSISLSTPSVATIPSRISRAGEKPPGNNPAHIVLRVHDWPAKDRALWGASIRQPVIALRLTSQPVGHAAKLRPKSIEGAWKAYGRFLHVLGQASRLNPDIGPGERVNFETVALFFDTLRDCGNRDISIKSRLFHLRMALHIMVPSLNFDWITRPNGESLDSILKVEREMDEFTPGSDILFRWGQKLMNIPLPDSLPANPHERQKLYGQYRNGLIIALLACRAPRINSLAQMCLEKNLYRRGDEYWARLQSSIVKNKRHLEYSLPPELTPCFDRYLAEIRPVMLNPARTDALWGNGDGGPYTYRSIQTMIFRQSLAEFGISFGPHKFRDSLATSLAMFDPRNPGLAAVILGITEQVVQQHYRKARQADAASKVQKSLNKARRKLKILC